MAWIGGGGCRAGGVRHERSGDTGFRTGIFRHTVLQVLVVTGCERLEIGLLCIHKPTIASQKILICRSTSGSINQRTVLHIDLDPLHNRPCRTLEGFQR